MPSWFESDHDYAVPNGSAFPPRIHRDGVAVYYTLQWYTPNLTGEVIFENKIVNIFSQI